MNALIFSFAAIVAVASAGLSGVVLQGPGSHAAVLGPDGSQIAASEQGGAIVSDVAHGYAAHTVAVPAIHAIPAVHAIPAIHAIPAVHGYAALGGLGGQYVPSGLENLHDDGSYRAEHHLTELLQNHY